MILKCGDYSIWFWFEEEVEFFYRLEVLYIYLDFEDYGNCFYVCFDVMSLLNVYIYFIGGFRRFSYNNIYIKCGFFKFY